MSLPVVFFLRSLLLHTVRLLGFSISDSLIWFSLQLAHPFQPKIDGSGVVARSEAPKCEGDWRVRATGVHPSVWKCHVQCSRCSLCRHARRVSRHNACGPSSTRRCEPVPGHWLQQPMTSHAVEFVKLSATTTTTGSQGADDPASKISVATPPRMPTAHLLASAHSTARCGSLQSCSASRHATLVSHLHANRDRLPSSWNSHPVALLVLLFVLISAAGVGLKDYSSSPGTLDLHEVWIRACWPRTSMGRGMWSTYSKGLVSSLTVPLGRTST